MHDAYHGEIPIWASSDPFALHARHTVFSQLPRPSTMDTESSKREKRRDDALSLLNAAVEAMNLAKEISSATPAKAVFGSVSVLLTMIMVRFLLFFDGVL